MKEGLLIIHNTLRKSIDEHFFNVKIMDTEEALSIFNLSSGESKSDIERRYRELDVEGGSPYISKVIRSAYQYLINNY